MCLLPIMLVCSRLRHSLSGDEELQNMHEVHVLQFLISLWRGFAARL